MELLLKQDQNSIYLNNIDLDEIITLDETCKKYFTILLNNKFMHEHINNIKYEIDENSIDNLIKIYTIKERYEKLRKEIFIFAELACSKNVKPNKKYIPFPNMEKLIEYSDNLIVEKRYHLIDINGRGIYLSNITNNDMMLDKWYTEKVLSKRN